MRIKASIPLQSRSFAAAAAGPSGRFRGRARGDRRILVPAARRSTVQDADANRKFGVEYRIIGDEPAGNLLAARERSSNGARGRSAEAGRLVALPSRRCAGRHYRSAHRPGGHDPAAGVGGADQGRSRPGAAPTHPRRRLRHGSAVGEAPRRPHRCAPDPKGARRGTLTAPEHQVQRPHLVDPMRADSPRICIAQSAIDALLQGVEILDIRRFSAPSPAARYPSIKSSMVRMGGGLR